MEIKLGFGQIPKSQYIFVNRESDYCWYMLSEDKRQIPIYDKALTGVITGIEVNKKVETSFGEAEKTDLSILADKPYIIRSGSDSYFSKSLLLSLDSLTFEQLRKPITITVSPGERTIVFCTIYDPENYRAIDINWDGHKELNWHSLGEKVSLKINHIHNSSQKHTEISEHSTIAQLREMMMVKIDTYLTELGWTKEEGKQYLQQKYGKRSRHHLTETELLDFMMVIFETLRSQAIAPPKAS
ncbi:hypothetical protein QUB80_07555 [Chlorogloeopsis sp. ULAP01]|uniref:hypothetical protein n=1 Tax=Chlorogloeopsis sp. ULAP01 TaxID=3056483 RepID=UPI0025AB1C4D|nr:hypothetical protein [Chlorogloeopsis sp. ULAP01]MDM9380560.1 hypothetical protein [Chlorogloeopsis sp. ULAP01]